MQDQKKRSRGGFEENRSIVDNVMVAYEIIHGMKCKRKGKVGEVALKIDISKAYDGVNWNFVQATMMLELGFHENWVN
jgi:hypothetical protein